VSHGWLLDILLFMAILLLRICSAFMMKLLFVVLGDGPLDCDNETDTMA
jgi:hypothetical protein